MHDHKYTRVETRDAISEDASGIALIYNQGIEERQATLETALRSTEDREAWLAGRGPRHPVIVAIEDREVIGWASLNQFNPRPVYDYVADISVYVGRAARGRGIGTALLTALEERARPIGYHKLVLAGFPSNGAAVRLYSRRGFRTVGIYREHGFLDGGWVDVVLMEKILV
jgi:L-amino acid N-acyltransferase YncA